MAKTGTPYGLNRDGSFVYNEVEPEILAEQLAFRKFGEPEEFYRYRPLEAGPGIQKRRHKGHLLLFRTARAKEEADIIRQAIARKDFRNAFTTSTHVGPAWHSNTFMKKYDSLVKRGKKPVFAGVIPTVSKYYTEPGVIEEGGGVFVLEVPEKDILHISPRAKRMLDVILHGAEPTGYDAHSVDFPDTEILFNARKVTRIAEIPLPIIQELNRMWEQVKHDHIRKGAFRNTFRTKDPEMVAARVRALANLVPELPTTLHRPFVEDRITIAGGLKVKRGDRVLLENGSQAKLTDFRKLEMEPEKRAIYWPEVKRYIFGVTNVKGELPYSKQEYERYHQDTVERIEKGDYFIVDPKRERDPVTHRLKILPPTPENIHADVVRRIQSSRRMNLPDTVIAARLEPGQRVTKDVKERMYKSWARKLQ